MGNFSQLRCLWADREVGRGVGLLLALLSLPSMGAPFGVADVVPEADICLWEVNGLPTENSVQAGPPPTCLLDLQGVPPGPFELKVKVRNSVWGAASDSPFTSKGFVNPGSLDAPASLRLEP